MANDLTRTEVGSKPVPDPTVATNEAVERAVKSERDYVDGQIGLLMERLRGIDIATALLSDGAAGVPVHIEKVVKHLRELHEERFSSIGIQFTERDTRSEREARDNKVAVDAAFAAQKEAAAKQDEANSKAIDKSELATAETISKLNELFKTETRALSDKLDDLKERTGRIESVKQGAVESRTDDRASRSMIFGAVATLGVILTMVVVIANLVTSGAP